MKRSHYYFPSVRRGEESFFILSFSHSQHPRSLGGHLFEQKEGVCVLLYYLLPVGRSVLYISCVRSPKGGFFSVRLRGWVGWFFSPSLADFTHVHDLHATFSFSRGFCLFFFVVVVAGTALRVDRVETWKRRGAYVGELGGSRREASGI